MSTGKSGDQTPATTPSLGIFWGVRDRAGPLVLVTERTSLAEAEPYGDFLTHSSGHYEVWEAWRRFGTASLSKRGLPRLIAWHEYEHFPRGRIVFDTTTNCFTLYADRKLQAPKVLARVLYAFSLDPARCVIRSDPHYRCWHFNVRPAEAIRNDRQEEP